ncbi:hypothetical protein LAZ67_13000169 [Cordylochernes scorpioides]|uniref:RNase H type-1 domain-containing protein n=1 Tax=Cordylochernes scorpioides TaxID=51811 RepID=A0ABY6L2M9_9ARAC|nr:hypothetical protein LAZ67_13000169 [Cordylochernes scorpioides]
MAHNSNLLDIPINPKHRTSYPPHKTRNKLICFPHLPDNPHKHETQPELLKALGLQIIEENSSLFDITIYTDGSQLETGLSGSGIAIYKDKILSHSHPRHLSVYKSELSAIDTALKDIHINLLSKIIIYSDSRAAIYTLQSCFSSQEPLLKSIAKSVNRLPANSLLTVQWLPAHVGIPDNELADSLAKAGALGLPEARESTTQLDERDLLRTIKTQCLQGWKSDAAHNWYRAGGTSTGSVLPREQQSLISRLKRDQLGEDSLLEKLLNSCPEPFDTDDPPQPAQDLSTALRPIRKALNSLKNDVYYFKRYVDDSILFIKQGSEQKNLDTFNNLLPDINYSMEVDNNKSINFLDMNLSYSNNNITTSIYKKPTHTGTCWDYSSQHHFSQKVGLVKALIYRAFTLINDTTKRLRKRLLLIEQLEVADGLRHLSE